MNHTINTSRFGCVRCGGHVQFDGDYQGQAVACPHCRGVVPFRVLTEPGGQAAPAGNPHVDSLRRAGRTIHRTVMGVGIAVVLLMLWAGVAERMDVHAEEHSYLLWSFAVALALAAWHRLAPPAINLVLDLVDRR